MSGDSHREDSTETSDNVREESSEKKQANEFIRVDDLCGDGGVIKKVLREGSGDLPKNGSKAIVHYVGRFVANGVQFDSSREKQTPFSFRLGSRQVIRGWEIGVATMKVGELAILICQSDYAYGEQGSPPDIPPRADLCFELEILAFEDPEPQSIEEKIKAALKRKDEGNYFFKEGSYNKAIYLYQVALDYFKRDWTMSEKERKEVDEVKIICLSNLAASHLKKNDFQKAISTCTTALLIDENNVKALYRRGQAYRLNGDFQQAKADLVRALHIAPSNKEIRDELNLTKSDENEYLQKQKVMFSAIFSNVPSDDKETFR